MIKPWSRLHRDVRNFLGTTVLGDGSVVLILDVLRLVEFGQSRHERLKATVLIHRVNGPVSSPMAASAIPSRREKSRCW